MLNLGCGQRPAVVDIYALNAGYKWWIFVSSSEQIIVENLQNCSSRLPVFSASCKLMENLQSHWHKKGPARQGRKQSEIFPTRLARYSDEGTANMQAWEVIKICFTLLPYWMGSLPPSLWASWKHPCTDAHVDDKQNNEKKCCITIIVI